jgi:hypothetical protein
MHPLILCIALCETVSLNHKPYVCYIASGSWCNFWSWPISFVFAKQLWKATLAPLCLNGTVQLFVVKFHIWSSYWTLSSRADFGENWTKITDTLHEDLCACILSHCYWFFNWDIVVSMVFKLRLEKQLAVKITIKHEYPYIHSYEWL